MMPAISMTTPEIHVAIRALETQTVPTPLVAAALAALKREAHR